MKLTSYATILLCLFCMPLYAGVLKGKITDTKGEPLPFATVFIKGTANGTSANADAVYQLQLAPGTYKVQCQYMGFSQATFDVTINGNEIVNHDFKLKEQTLELKDVVIKANAEDPAYAIIRKAIARRKFHLDQVRSFQTSVYLKGVLRNRKMENKMFGVSVSDGDKKEMSSEMGLDSAGKGVMYLVEELADYYAKGNEQRTVIRSVRVSGNPNGMGMSQMPTVVTFYENNVEPMSGVSPRGFISPISDNAIFYYRYKYEGEFMENGYRINKIKVMPRRDYEPLLTGTIYIVEDEWAIHSLKLFATKKANLEMLDTLLVEQTHLPLKPDTWVIKSQVLYPTIGFFGLDISGHFITAYNNQKVNEPIPDSIFNTGKVTSTYLKDANKKDTAYWADARLIPLEADEGRNYEFKDSVNTVTGSPQYRDSMRRLANKFELMDLVVGGYTYRTKEYKNVYSTNAITNGLINFNTVEGVYVAPKLSWTHSIDTGKTLKGDFAVRYGFGNTHLNGIGKISYRKSDRKMRGKFWEAGVQGGKYVFQYNPNSTLEPLYNTISTLLYGQNYMKLYERWDGTAFLDNDYANGFRWSAKASFQRRLPLANTVRYAFTEHNRNKLTPNLPQELWGANWEEHNAAIIKLTASYQPGYKYTKYPEYMVPQGSDAPIFSISYEKGIPGIADSKTDFDKWRFGIHDDMSLKLLGSISYDVSVGGFLNKNYVSLPDMMHLADNQLALAAPYVGSFQLAPYYRYSNTEDIYGELHLEYYMKGLLTNKIPLLRQAKWYLVAGTNTFYAAQSNYYTEAYVGVTNLGYKMARFLRVDYVQGWDNMSRVYRGFRVGIDLSTLGSAISLSSGKPDGDWR